MFLIEVFIHANYPFENTSERDEKNKKSEVSQPKQLIFP